MSQNNKLGHNLRSNHRLPKTSDYWIFPGTCRTHTWHQSDDTETGAISSQHVSYTVFTYDGTGYSKAAPEFQSGHPLDHCYNDAQTHKVDLRLASIPRLSSRSGCQIFPGAGD